MSGTIQNLIENLKPGRNERKAMNRDFESRTNFFSPISQSHYIKRKKLQKAKQKDEAIKGFFVAVLFLIFGTLFIMLLNP